MLVHIHASQRADEITLEELERRFDVRLSYAVGGQSGLRSEGLIYFTIACQRLALIRLASSGQPLPAEADYRDLGRQPRCAGQQRLAKVDRSP